MIRVKPRPDGGDIHVAVLAGLLFGKIRTAFDPDEWEGLRQSHFRLLSNVPDTGLTITELAEVLGMTKQGCGQFVTALVASKHLRTASDRHDRRVRRVFRTARADRLMRAVDDHLATLEQEWATQVGPRRYATFRTVLTEIIADELR